MFVYFIKAEVRREMRKKRKMSLFSRFSNTGLLDWRLLAKH